MRILSRATLVLIMLLMSGCLEAKTKPLVFERVIDGDTFVASGQKIRIWGIDAPEKDHPFFSASKSYLKVLIEDKALDCRQYDTDRYKRAVMRCFVEGKDIAEYLVFMGLATDYKRYSNGAYDLEENIAKQEKRGIWSLKD